MTTAGEALKAAEFTVNRVEFEQQMALARLRPADGADTSRTVTIVSPVDGVILKRTHESEVVVQAGEPLLEIGDPGIWRSSPTCCPPTPCRCRQARRC